MSRYTRSAAAGGGLAGALNGGDGSGLCCLRTEWETLYQCDAVPETNWGCGINWVVDTSKYSGFKFYLYNFCGPTCQSCGLYVGVYDSSGETCSCSCSSWILTAYGTAAQSAAASSNSNIFNSTSQTNAGTNFRTVMCLVSSGLCSSGWRAGMGHQTSSSGCFMQYQASGNLYCGMKWCDINSVCFSINQNMLTPSITDASLGGGYVAVYGLKNPLCCSICQITYCDT